MFPYLLLKLFICSGKTRLLSGMAETSDNSLCALSVCQMSRLYHKTHNLPIFCHILAGLWYISCVTYLLVIYLLDACLVLQPQAHSGQKKPEEASHFPDVSLEAASNYCRNPTRRYDERPWCYTTHPGIRWGYCDVPECAQTTGKSFK